MKKERPILFSTAMIQAFLAGAKTQTRRIVKLKHLKGRESEVGAIHKDGSGTGWIAWIPGIQVTAEDTMRAYPGEQGFRCPYGQVGDILWVRETFSFLKYGDCDPFFGYKADGIGPAERKYKPSIHMPKAAARIWLEITDIRVERVQDIGEQDAFEEGAYDGKGPHGVGYLLFEELWVNINGVESWEANPFVWCLTFKVLSTTGRPDKL